MYIVLVVHKVCGILEDICGERVVNTKHSANEINRKYWYFLLLWDEEDIFL